MSAVTWRGSPGPSAAGSTRGAFVPVALGWAVLIAGVTVGIVALGPGTQPARVLGNLAILAALGFSVLACGRAARRRTSARRGWAWMTAAMVLGSLGQILFTVAVLQGKPVASSPVSDAIGYLGYALPAVVALFLFPKPSERLVSLFRRVLDVAVIALGLVLVSEATVLNVVRGNVDTSTVTGLSGLAFPVVDLAICAVVLTLGMIQPPQNRFVWLCLGGGLVSLAVTDSLYVRLLAQGFTGLTGTALVAGWVAAPALIGLATLIPAARTHRGWDFSLPVALVPYVPALAAALIVGLRRAEDPFLIVGGLLLLVVLTVRQVMIVYENLSLTRDLEAKVAARTAELNTLGSIVTSSNDAIVGVSLDNVINAWNPSAERLFGISTADVLGRTPSFLPELGSAGVQVLLGTAARREPLETYQLDWTRPDQTTVPVEVTVSPVLDGDVVAGISISGQDITERRQTAAALEQAREEALESSRLKSEFLATMSHEIRTPLNGVIGLTSLLLETGLDGVQRRYVEGVNSAGQALLYVINDILDFSKLEAGKVVLDPDDFDLRQLIDEVGKLLAPAAFAKGLELLASCPPDSPPVVHGDHSRIRQVLLNLASNGVKFTAAGEVAISVEPLQVGEGTARLRFEVRDTGIGIAEVDQARLFESFSQADASTTRRYGGTGLGLAISRQLVEVMNGEIGMVSSPGLGSTFWFELTLPLGAALAEPPVRPTQFLATGLRVLVVDDNATNRTILDEQLSAWGMKVHLFAEPAQALAHLRTELAQGRCYDVAVLDMLMPDVDGLQLARSITEDPGLAGLPLLMLTSAQRPPVALLREVGIGGWLSKPVSSSELYEGLAGLIVGAGPSGAREVTSPASDVTAGLRGRVLVVEDNTLNQLVAVGMVTRLGYEVDTAENGREALEAVRVGDYAAILMDCHMPVMDGFAATREIRRYQGRTNHTPIIALTAGALASDRERCLAAGMDDYISKPIDHEALEAVLERWVPEVSVTPPRPPTEREPQLSAADPVIDETRLSDLAKLQTRDGTSLLASFVAAFSSRSIDRIAAVQHAVEAADHEALTVAAHELKGSAATIGAVRVAAVSGEIERAGLAECRPDPELLAQLGAELEQANDALGAISPTLTDPART